MFIRGFLSFFAILIVSSGQFAAFYESTNAFTLPAEPLIRIGLSTNSSSVSITTSDSSLVAYSPDEANKLLAANRITVSARSYRPPVIDLFRFEIQDIETAKEANDIAETVREQTDESALVSLDTATKKWKIWIGGTFETIEEAAAFKAMLTEKGIEDAVMESEKQTVVSDDAKALTAQMNTQGKSEVRSLIKTTSSSQPITSDVVNPNLREVVVNGASTESKYASLKSVSFGSFNERANPVRLNGKAYRGKIEVFVNSKGSLTVVNVVPLEEYLLGVVPAELSLPNLEAQKAQAIAARTYAVANIGGYGKQGFDMLPTVWSQVYKGVSIETSIGTRAVRETSGKIATYKGKPIMAYFTSTCGGRTENSENIFDHAEPYLRGVECSLEGHKHFEPFTIRSNRKPAKLRDDGNLELVRLMAFLSVNGFAHTAESFTDDWFEDHPTQGELASWLAQLALKFGKPFPAVTKDTAKPVELIKLISSLQQEPGVADVLMSNSDIDYQLSFDDADEVPKELRPQLAMLMRDGYFTLHPDMTLRPHAPFSRGKMLRLIRAIYEKRKWMPSTQSGETKATVDGKLVLRSGRSERQLMLRPDVFLFRQYGSDFYQVKEAALMGGEKVEFVTDAAGQVSYLEIQPTETPTVAENMSPFTNWSATVNASTLQSRLSRYVRGIGTLYDVNIKKVGYSRRPVEIEIIGSNGVKTLKGGKIRSALRLREQLFVINKRYSGDRVVSYTFTGRGWGHGVGMCQYGAYGLAKMGVKADEIIKHYYSGVDVPKLY